MPLGERRNRAHVGGLAVEMDRHDGRRARGDSNMLNEVRTERWARTDRTERRRKRRRRSSAWRAPPADAGSVHAGGVALDAHARARRLAYIPDGIAPWPAQTIRWALDFTIGYFGGRAGQRDAIVRVRSMATRRTKRRHHTTIIVIAGAPALEYTSDEGGWHDHTQGGGRTISTTAAEAYRQDLKRAPAAGRSSPQGESPTATHCDAGLHPASDKPFLRPLVLHDDAEREFDSHERRRTGPRTGLERRSGWTVASIRYDWATVF